VLFGSRKREIAATRHQQTQTGSPETDPQLRLASEERLWARFSSRHEPAVRQELIRRYLPFAGKLTQRYRGASESFDDLLQVASLGLVNAIDRFEPSRGVPFTAFASPTILGELKRHFRDRVWTVRVPRSLHDRLADVDEAVTALTRDLQRSPTIAEIARRLHLDESEVLEALEANRNRRPLSLDRPTKPDDSEETPAADWIGEVDEGYELVEGKAAVEAALPGLDERERTVLRLRFVDDLTQSQIAERIGFSQMHVSRILRDTLRRIREQIEERP
jgi:RNA polymerase sigma-B factor